jgi:hypothetical protein
MGPSCEGEAVFGVRNLLKAGVGFTNLVVAGNEDHMIVKGLNNTQGMLDLGKLRSNVACDDENGSLPFHTFVSFPLLDAFEVALMVNVKVRTNKHTDCTPVPMVLLSRGTEPTHHQSRLCWK